MRNLTLSLLVLLITCFTSDCAHAGDAAVDAFRAGEFSSARSLWQEQLAAATTPAERSRIAYNIGNTAYREGKLHLAIGWYTRALRDAPRDEDVWANLELARSEAELEPADRGDLRATIRRHFLMSFGVRGSQWSVLASLVLLAVCFAGEALRGGLLWRRLIWLSIGAVLIACIPWAWNTKNAASHPLMIVEPGGAQARSEPNRAAKVLRRYEAGTELEYVDELPDWIKVEDDRDRSMWVARGTVLDLLR